MVSTQDSESCDPGSTPGRTFLLLSQSGKRQVLYNRLQFSMILFFRDIIEGVTVKGWRWNGLKNKNSEAQIEIYWFLLKSKKECKQIPQNTKLVPFL